MIFVTVGLHEQGFERLVRAADEMASLVEEPVLIQRGDTRFTPQFAQYFDFTDETEVQKWLSEARVVVSHGGAGSILNALYAGKPLVVAPRLKRFDEHIDDHQLELAEVLAQYDKAVAVTDLSGETLLQAIAEAMQLNSSKRSASNSLQTALRVWLGEQAAQPRPSRWRFLQRVCQGG